MGAVLPWLARILAFLGELFGILQTVKAVVGLTAQQDDLVIVRDIAQLGTTAVQDPISGTHAIWALLEAVQSGGTPSLQSILDVLANLTPTPLPPTPPVDWPGEIGAGVLSTPLLMPYWGEEQPLQRNLDVALYEMEANLMGMTGGAGWPSREAPDFALVGTTALDMWVTALPGGSHVEAPTSIDWRDWDGIETLASLLTRVQARFAWDHYGPSGYPSSDTVWGRLIGGDTHFVWRCLVRESELPLVSGRLWDAVAVLSIGLPPVWPGAANTTPATPTILTDSGIITAPMHGITLTIDSLKAGVGHFGVDGMNYAWRAGYVAFLTDTGAAEEVQYLGWDTAVYLPRRMAVAAGVLIVLGNALQVTATPFTIP